MSRVNNLQRSLFGGSSASGADSSFALEHSSQQELARMITSEIHDQMRLFASLEKLFHHPLRLLPLGSPVSCAHDIFTTPRSSLTPADSTLKLLSPLIPLPDPDTIVQMLEMYGYLHFIYSSKYIFTRTRMLSLAHCKRDALSDTFIYRYYCLDDTALRELLGKKLTSRERRELEDSEETGAVRIRSSRRQVCVLVLPRALELFCMYYTVVVL